MSEPHREQKLRDRWEQQLRADPAVVENLLLVLLTMATHGGRDGTSVRVSQATLSDATGLGKSTVRRHQARGVELGWLRQESRGRRTGNGQTTSSVYSLALPFVAQPPMGERLTDGSTAQERAVVSTYQVLTRYYYHHQRVRTAQPLDLNRSTAHWTHLNRSRAAPGVVAEFPSRRRRRSD